MLAVMAPNHESITLTTPHGHEVQAVIDYAHFELKSAKVVHTHTGVIKPLDTTARDTLARALKAKQVYEHALSETEAVEHTLKTFGKVADLLGNQHPALAPYWREAAQHRHIADDMERQARRFHAHAMEAIDAIAEGAPPR